MKIIVLVIIHILTSSLADALRTSSSIFEMCIIIDSVDQRHVGMCHRAVARTANNTYACAVELRVLMTTNSLEFTRNLGRALQIDRSNGQMIFQLTPSVSLIKVDLRI